jgi:hypothetical protein
MLYLLKPVVAGPEERRWAGGYRAFSNYDTAHGFVVRANSEREARDIARRAHLEEATICHYQADGWLDPEKSTCEPISHDGEPGVVLMDWSEG